ncbi:MAG: prolyl oligopeptidase family serine peptidase [Actinomycetota bacterium]|nr:prolyl oligopeptidase family serine peptidase [Actinomycetota bacterium]
MAPIPAERCIAGRDLSEPRLAPGGEVLVYAVAVAGTATLVVHTLATGGERAIATNPALRPGRGTGGGAWCFRSDRPAVVYVAVDGNLHEQPLAGGPSVRLTDHGPERAISNPQLAPDGCALVYVLDQAQVLSRDCRTGVVRRLDAGDADFCLDPCIAPDSSSVVWHAWDVPDMPWDHSRVQRAALPGGGAIAEVLRPAGSVQQPRVLPDGTIAWVRDDDGWLNVWVGDRPVVAEPFEHAGPTWGPGQCSYVFSPDGGHLAFTRNEHGFGRLCVATISGGIAGEVREVARGVHAQLSWQGDRLAALRSGARTPTEVVYYDTSTWQRTVVAVGPSPEWQRDELAEPMAVEIDTADGVVHARLYAADDPQGRLIIWLHGGPSDQWAVGFLPRIAFWRSRGWNILVPDHRGSTGHGREYQQALRGRWGELDVADTVAVAREAHRRGWGLPSCTVLMGGSAGGFTALAATALEPTLFGATVVSYPVTDLADLAERSHRFERHYTVSLVGPLPASAAEYRRRSPAYHAGRYRRARLLILHGELDSVVPVEQSRVFAERVRTAGGGVELHVYPDEGHGFRQAANQLDEYRRIEDFLARCVPVASRS